MPPLEQQHMPPHCHPTPQSNNMPPQEQPCTPAQGATMHVPPGVTMHAPLVATTHAPPGEQPHTPPESNHASLPGATTQPPQATTHAPPWTECGHTLLKILPCPNFIVGGNYHQYRSVTDENIPEGL